MSSGVVVDFNRLPRTTRERIVDSLGSEPRLAPLFADRDSKVKPVFWWSVLALYFLSSYVGMVLRDFGHVGPNIQSVHGPALIPFYLFPAFFVIAGVLGVAFHLKRRAALPFAAGRYLFPLDFVDARSKDLRIISLSELEDIKAVHHHTNGAYTHTRFTLFFGGRDREEFTVRGQDEAEEQLRNLQQARATFGKALQQQDANTIQRLDLFFDVRTRGGFEALKDNASSPWQEQGLVARELPRVLQKRLLTTIALGLVLAPSTWLVRNLLSDHLAFNMAKTQGIESGFRDYLRTGWLHVDEAKELGWAAGFADCEKKDTEACWRDYGRNWQDAPRLQEVRVERMPRAALKEAANTVSALRRFRKNYPASVVDAEAKARIHQLFADSFTLFQEQASTKNPQLVPFVGKLLAHLEATENPQVLVRFRREASSSLQTADKLVGRAGLKEGRLTAEVSPHFTDERITPLEDTIAKAMGTAFKEIFPTDLLALKKAPALSAEQDASSESLPVLGIHYKVGWSGATYSSSKDSRLFVGIAFDFDVAMSLPNEKPLNFSLNVKPPDHFNVEYSRYVNRGGIDLDPSGGPTSETVYRIMALRAFDELDDKLRNTFFRPTSKAFLAGQDE